MVEQVYCKLVTKTTTIKSDMSIRRAGGSIHNTFESLSIVDGFWTSKMFMQLIFILHLIIIINKEKFDLL